jgi:peptidyl-prolyl cis-trans isomerase B (cyclophilin B)
VITLQTNFGAISIELDFVNAPKTSENFLKYAKEGFYDGTIFHRVINGFMIQGGGFGPEMKHKETDETIKNEAPKSLPNKRGTLAMARTSDPHSASTQFFINVQDNDFLNFTSESANGWGYCVFAKVVDGMDIVDQIRKVPTTTRGGHQDVPTSDVVIEKVTVTEEAVDAK